MVLCLINQTEIDKLKWNSVQKMTTDITSRSTIMKFRNSAVRHGLTPVQSVSLRMYTNTIWMKFLNSAVRQRLTCLIRWDCLISRLLVVSFLELFIWCYTWYVNKGAYVILPSLCNLKGLFFMDKHVPESIFYSSFMFWPLEQLSPC